jgi:hypothetical protein
MISVKWVLVAVLILVSGCTYGPQEELAQIENVAVRPDSFQFAVAVRYDRFQPATGITAFPNGGTPNYLEKTAIVYLVDVSKDEIVELARIKAPDPLKNGFSAWMTGWKADAAFLQLSGCSESDCYGDLRQFQHFVLNPKAQPRMVEAPPEDIERIPGMLARAPEEKVYMRVSADSRVISVRTDDSEPFTERYMIQSSGELLEIEPND